MLFHGVRWPASMAGLVHAEHKAAFAQGAKRREATAEVRGSPPPALTGPILPQLTEGCPARGRTALNSQVPLSWQVESVNKSWGEEMGEKNGVHITLHSSGPRIWKLLSRSMRK